MKHTQAYDLHIGEEGRSPASIDRFFVLVADWLAAKEAVISDSHAWIGNDQIHEGAA
jgi:hypothetical protein